MPTRREFLQQASALAAALASSRRGRARQAAPPPDAGKAKRSLKILFIARHYSYLRLFESAVIELAGRGHQITLAADRVQYQTLLRQTFRTRSHSSSVISKMVL